MDDMVAFLRARLDERAAKLRRLIASESADEYLDEEEYSGGRDWWGEFGEVASEVANFHEMLAEVHAKRRIIEVHQPQEHPRPKIDLQYCVTCMDVKSGYQEDWKEEVWPCATLRLLALPYADHPDYREEWRPET